MNHIGRPTWRRALRLAWFAAALSVFFAVVQAVPSSARHTYFSGGWVRGLKIVVGLWVVTSLFALVAVKLVAGGDWLWRRLRRLGGAPQVSQHSVAAHGTPPPELPNPSRRYFFQSATYLAGAVPFVAAVYGFAAERLRYRVERVDVPFPNLSPALDGLRIAQLSDIHIGGYMPREQVRRAVEMANALGAHLAVVTGDFLTGASDPIEDCIAELSRLRAPLGVWGCNGNHEIYADMEGYAAELFRRAGMRLLRGENTELVWRGERLNLIGVDYQRERAPSGRRLPKLAGVERLLRRDAPNILLSHNPNAFPRAAELGIELTLAGHTHGGQVQVEILDHKWSPARFLTPFIAGLYTRPFGSVSPQRIARTESTPHATSPSSVGDPAPLAVPHTTPNIAYLYVNRGLGTIGAPIRLGVPPEITLLTLRRT